MMHDSMRIHLEVRENLKLLAGIKALPGYESKNEAFKSFTDNLESYYKEVLDLLQKNMGEPYGKSFAYGDDQKALPR